jgi:hypothetical protein
MSYKKGQSGNTRGRAAGIPDKRAQLRELLVPHAQALIDETEELAKCGDTTALRLRLERLLPPVCAKHEPVELGQVTGNLTDQGQAIVDASLTGKITPNQASALMQALMAQVRAVDADEFASRLDAIEQKVNQTR